MYNVYPLYIFVFVLYSMLEFSYFILSFPSGPGDLPTNQGIGPEHIGPLLPTLPPSHPYY